MIFILDYSDKDDKIDYDLTNRSDQILYFEYDQERYKGLPVILKRRFDHENSFSGKAMWATVTGTRRNWHNVIKEINRTLLKR